MNEKEMEKFIDETLAEVLEERTVLGLQQIRDYLSKTSPAGMNVPLNSEGATGWTLYHVMKGDEQSFIVYADGVYCGFSGKQKLFYLDADGIDEIQDFYFLQDGEKLYLETFGHEIDCDSTKRIEFVESV